MEKDRIMCEVVQNTPEAGDPSPGTVTFLQLAIAIRLEASYFRHSTRYIMSRYAFARICSPQ